MKKIIIFLLCLFFIIPLFASCDNDTDNKSNVKVSEKSISQSNDKVKSVWLTYYELSELTKSCKTDADFKKSIKSVFKNLHKSGFNTVTVQVRPCADAFYQSAYFPPSKYCFGSQDCKLIYDPLKIMVEIAHNQKLKIEAWINPYRVSQDSDVSALSDKNIAKQWINKNNGNVYVTDSNIYFNPAKSEVNELIVNGVKEIVSNYDVDAIHFDDYFYPTKNKDIDSKEYEDYKSTGGSKSLGDWRRDIVSNMIKSVYSAIKSTNINVKFGVSPAGNIDNDYSALYADVIKWSTEQGYVDYICPQIYFGFKNEDAPFMKTVKEWNSFAKCDIYIGLPLYKCSQIDDYAGDSGVDEFVKSHNIISRQIEYINKIPSIDGYYIFSYSFLNDEKLKEEVSDVYSAMQ